MKVQRYYPAYYDDSYERTECDIGSKDELLALPFVRSWEEDENFEGWCYENSGGLPFGHLVCLVRDGPDLAWFVVATLYPSGDLRPETWFDKPPYTK